MWSAALTVTLALTAAEQKVVDWLRAGLDAEQRAWNCVRFEYDASVVVEPEWFQFAQAKGTYRRELDLGRGSYIHGLQAFRLDRTERQTRHAVYAFDGTMYKMWVPDAGYANISWAPDLARIRTPRLFLTDLPELPGVGELLEAAQKVSVEGDTVIVESVDHGGQQVTIRISPERTYYPFNVQVRNKGRVMREISVTGRPAYPAVDATMQLVNQTWFVGGDGVLRPAARETLSARVVGLAKPQELSPEALAVPDGFTVVDERFAERYVVGRDEEGIVSSQAKLLSDLRGSLPGAGPPTLGATTTVWALAMGMALLGFSLYSLLTGRPRSAGVARATAILLVVVCGATAGAHAGEERKSFQEIMNAAKVEQSCAYWSLRAWSKVEAIEMDSMAVSRKGPHSLGQVSTAVRNAGVDAEWVKGGGQELLSGLRHAFIAYQPAASDKPGHFAVGVVTEGKGGGVDILAYDFPEPARRYSVSDFERKYRGPFLVTGSDVARVRDLGGHAWQVAAALAGLMSGLGAGWYVQRRVAR